MAITKILYMKDCGGNFHGKHLKSSLEYVMNLEKTQNGRLIGAINCQPDTAFEQMKETKRKFNKIGKRQGYHLILSFKEDEVEPDTAFEITHKFVSEYLGKSYDEFMMLGDRELGRRISKLDEKEQKDKVNRELGNELEFMDESQKSDNSSSGGTGGNSLGRRQVVAREKPAWEDTISNRLLHWNYSIEQKEEVRKAIAAGISKTKIMEYFYPDVSIEQMRTYREAQAAMH